MEYRTERSEGGYAAKALALGADRPHNATGSMAKMWRHRRQTAAACVRPPRGRSPRLELGEPFGSSGELRLEERGQVARVEPGRFESTCGLVVVPLVRSAWVSHAFVDRLTGQLQSARVSASASTPLAMRLVLLMHCLLYTSPSPRDS